MPTVIVYRQPACAVCGQVERYLRDRGVPFFVRDIDVDPAAMEYFLALGYLATPVTVVNGSVVPGYLPKRLAQLLSCT
jgi:glutaredoxin-like protein NrdH